VESAGSYRMFDASWQDDIFAVIGNHSSAAAHCFSPYNQIEQHYQISTQIS
jgi:hypothetical protein